MLSLREALGLLEGALLTGPGELRLGGVAIDSRKLCPGELFVAISGERFDGHDFVETAKARGAVAALVERPLQTSLPTIQVPNTRHALGQLALGWRRRFQIPLIAVVGSNGKTTSKEMIAAILAAHFGKEGRLATCGNMNNDIGVPMTLLALRSAHRAAVIEIGMNHPEETRWLAHIAAPNVCLITNAQREHQEFMKNIRAVAAEHALAIESLSPQGVAVFPSDDDEAGVWRRAAGSRRAVEFAVNTTQESECSVKAVAHLERLETVIHLDTPIGAITARLAVAGLHNARNATAAAAATLAAGIPLDAIRQGLEDFSAVAGRLQPLRTRSGALLIDDSYNANPDSMRAAIEVLAASPGPTLLILGDMGEVGASAHLFHTEIGTFANERGIGRLFAIGDQMRAAIDAFGERGRHFASSVELIAATEDWLAARLAEDTTVLVKGSRFMGMETIVRALAGPVSGPAIIDGHH